MYYVLNFIFFYDFHNYYFNVRYFYARGKRVNGFSCSQLSIIDMNEIKPLEEMALVVISGLIGNIKAVDEYF